MPSGLSELHGLRVTEAQAAVHSQTACRDVWKHMQARPGMTYNHVLQHNASRLSRAWQADLEGNVGPSLLLRLQTGCNRQVPSCRVPTHSQAPTVAAQLAGVGSGPADRRIRVPVGSWEPVLRRKPAGKANILHDRCMLWGTSCELVAARGRPIQPCRRLRL